MYQLVIIKQVNTFLTIAIDMLILRPVTNERDFSYKKHK